MFQSAHVLERFSSMVNTAAVRQKLSTTVKMDSDQLGIALSVPMWTGTICEIAKPSKQGKANVKLQHQERDLSSAPEDVTAEEDPLCFSRKAELGQKLSNVVSAVLYDNFLLLDMCDTWTAAGAAWLVQSDSSKLTSFVELHIKLGDTSRGHEDTPK